MFSFTNFLKGLSILNDSDQTKVMSLTVSPSATTGTTLTLVAAQTANRTITLPDQSGTIITNGSPIPVNQLAAMTPNKAVATDGSGFLTTSATSATELGYLTGATSNIQAQLNTAATNPMTTLGDMIYENATPVPARVPGNTTATKNFLTQTGNGSISAAPTWGTISSTDINGTIAIANGGTGQTTATTAFNALSPMTTGGDLIYGGTSGAGTRLANGTLGQLLTSNGSTSAPSWVNATSFSNFVVNSAFDYWQAGTSGVVTAAGGGSPVATNTYCADQWVINNILGGSITEGQISWSQQTAVTDGSLFALKVQISTAPSGAGVNNSGVEVYTLLSNKASLALYNKTASFSVLVKGLSSTTQVGLQFYYQGAESFVTHPIGSEVLTTVNASTFTLCSINGQALGTAQTTAGIIGVRIRQTTGTASVNNGFILEQAMLNLGSTAFPFTRQYNDPVQELAACQYFYEKSYRHTTAPGTITQIDMFVMNIQIASAINTIQYKVTKRGLPSLTYYSPATGTSGKARDATAAADVNCVDASTQGTNSFNFTPSIATAGHQMQLHWVSDSRM